MAGIKDYSTTASSNTSVGGISIAEGMLPSNINNAFRAFAADVREWYNDSQWVIYGDGDGSFTIAYASSTSFTVSGVDVTSFYHVGRRIKAIATTPGTIFGTISASTFSTNTTVTVTWDSGSLSNETITVYVAALSKTNDSIPELVITNAKVATNAAIAATKIHDGSVSNTEFGYLDGVTSAIQTQIDSKQATITGGASTIVSSDLTADRALVSNGSGKVAVSSVTATELGYVSGVTSAIQTQIGTKLTASNNLSDVSSASTARTNLGLAIGTNVQAYDAELQAIAGLTSAADKGIQFTGSGTAGTYDLTTAGKALLDDADATAQRTTLGLGTIATQSASSVNISGGSITGLSSPSNNSDAVTKQYVDDLLAGIRKRTTVRAASTANVTIASALENGDTLDGITLVTGDNVLLKNQTTASQNGIYTVVASGAASRATEFDIFDELAGQLVAVQEGSTNADLLFLCTANFGGTLGSTNITYQSLNVTTLDLVQDASPQLGGDLDINGFSIVSTSNGNITLQPNGTGDVVLSADTVKIGDVNANATITTDGTGDLILNTNSGSSSGAITIEDGANANITIEPNGTGDILLNADTVRVGDSGANATITSNGAGDLILNTNSGTNSGSITITNGANANIELQPNGTGDVYLSADTVRIGDSNTDAVLTTNGTGDITISTNSGSNSGTVKIFDGANANIEITPNGTGVVKLDGLSYPTADGTANQVLQTNGSGTLSFATVTADGTADWDTTVKTTGFTATANKGYFCNTTSAAFTVTLPASPTAGDEIIILDYAGTFDTNALTINPNGNKIEGATSSLQLSGEREGARLVYIDTTQGWLAYSGINEGTDALSPVPYSIDFLVIAGGGGSAYYGAGGAGGYRTSTQTVSGGTVITVTVGDGGSGGTTGGVKGTNGSDSSISGSGLTTITSAGGGAGGGQGPINTGSNGGSGGGGSASSPGTGGSGNTPSTSPSQGNNGGTGGEGGPYSTGGGGGGAGGVGSNGSSSAAGNGGNGTASSITGSSVTRAGGGGGGTGPGNTAGTGGTGGGGDGVNSGVAGTAGTANTGGGAGGSGFSPSGGAGAVGGKGVVILSVPTASYSSTTSGSPTVTTSGSNTILQFNGSGSYTA